MKKILSLLLVLVTMLAVCTSLVACGGAKPNLNLSRAEANLKENGYHVDIEDGEEYSGYRGAAIERTLYAYDEDDNEIYIYEFKDAKAARLYYNNMKSAYGKGSAYHKWYKRYLKKYGDDLTREEREDVEDWIEEIEEEVCGRSGKYVWFGTKDAVNATK